MKQTRRLFFAAWLLALGLLAGTIGSANANEGDDEPIVWSSEPPVSQPDQNPDEPPGDAATPPCHGIIRGDYVHRSGATASAHGWIDNIDCGATTVFIVSVRLEQFVGSGWQNTTAAVEPRTAPATNWGSGRGQRANGRGVCVSSEPTYWRSVVLGRAVRGSYNTLYTTPQIVSCRAAKVAIPPTNVIDVLTLLLP